MPPVEDTTLELRDYLRVLQRRKWIIIVTVLICALGAFAMTFRQAPVYSTNASVLLQTSTASSSLIPSQAQDPTSSDRIRANEIQIMGGPQVRAEVAKTLGREPESASFTPQEGSDVVDIGVTSTNAKRAAATANAYAKTYIKVRRDLTVSDLQESAKQVEDRIVNLDFQIGLLTGAVNAKPEQTPIQQASDPDRLALSRLASRRDSFAQTYNDLVFGEDLAKHSGATVLAPAGVPGAPQNHSPLTNVLAGIVIGLVLGIALAFLREYLDDRVKTKEDLETASGQTVIGLIPELPDWKNREATQLIAIAQPRSAAAEAYRAVRTSVEFLALDQPIGSLQVTSAMAGEGKTTTLANLAITFARVGQRVIVLCCDLRRPRVHEFFGMSNRVGFTSMLLGDAPANEAIQAVRGDLPIGLVASGPLAPNPAELLASKRAVSVIEELDSQCDLLLIDSPPVLPVTDAQVISGLVDGVLLVSNSGTSNKRDVRRAVELLHQVDAPLIGSILNNVHSKDEAVYTYGDNRYYLDAQQPTEPERRNGRRGKRGAPAKAAR